MDAIPGVIGYLDRLSFTPGDRFCLYASGDGTPVDVDLVALRHGPAPTGEATVPVTEVPWEGRARIAPRRQRSCVGSFLVAPAPALGRGLTLGSWIWPTLTTQEAPQTIAALVEGETSLIIALEGGRVRATLRTSDGTATAETSGTLNDRTWYSIAATAAQGELTLEVHPADAVYGERETVVANAPEPEFSAGATLTYAAARPSDVTCREGYARGRADSHFTGKLAYPFVLGGRDSAPGPGLTRERLTEIAASGALWDLSPRRLTAERHTAPPLAGAAWPAILVNLPTQGVTGPDWDATELDFRMAPEQYSAAHFHHDDLVDAGWEPALEASFPSDLRSGVYGIRLTAHDGSIDIVPAFLGPAEDAVRKPILLVMPTFTYMAYANEDLISFFQQFEVHALHDEKIQHVARSRQVPHSAALGVSAYDLHADGSGVHFSSSLRPVLDMRADYRFWAYTSGTRSFPADLYLLQWLNQNGYEFDVCTDLEVHRGGAGFLDDYQAVLLGSHPEYHSREILDALAGYRDDGGKLCYLGGNGLYWVTGLANEDAQIIEVRRGHVGIRTWESEPGEVTLVSSWEPGGLWRFRGRPPQRIVGVGMAAQGGASRPYHLPAADGPARRELAWFYAGIEGETIGEKGWVHGAAAGDEFDRVDLRLGTPPGTVVLASSRDHPQDAQRAHEEILQMFHGSSSGPRDPEVRADMTYLEVPGGGAVFSAGSIAFIASLLVDEGENTSSRALRNVIDHFLRQ